MDKIIEYSAIARIIAKSFTDGLTAAEQDVLDAWLADSGHREFYESLHGRDLAERGQRLSHIKNKERNWHRIRRRTAPATWMRYAAAACVVLAAAGTFLLLRDRDGQTGAPQNVIIVTADGRSVELPPAGTVEFAGQSRGAIARGDGNTLTITAGEVGGSNGAASEEYHTIIIPRGADYRLELADGSVARLNADTRLRFPVAFGDSCRRVFVEGEACFDVVHTPERPFIVDAGDVRVEVLGTYFGVSAYPADAEVRTTLVCGAVRMVDREGRTVTLAPDEQAVFDRATGGMTVQAVDARAQLGWTDNLFVFRNQTVEQIMRQLSRWYDVEVAYGGEQVKGMRFTGNFDRSSQLADILAMLSVVYDVEFSLSGNTVTVDMK